MDWKTLLCVTLFMMYVKLTHARGRVRYLSTTSRIKDDGESFLIKLRRGVTETQAKDCARSARSKLQELKRRGMKLRNRGEAEVSEPIRIGQLSFIEVKANSRYLEELAEMPDVEVAEQEELLDIYQSSETISEADESLRQHKRSIHTKYKINKKTHRMQKRSTHSLEDILGIRRRNRRQSSTCSQSFGTYGGLVWGVDRIDSRNNIVNGKYEPQDLGEGSTVYVLDTGIKANHVEFEDRAVAPSDLLVPGFTSNVDDNGHGTHVAGIIAGKNYGVAKKATVVGIKVLGGNGEGSLNSVLWGISYALFDANRRGTKAIINLSLSGGKSEVFNAGIEEAASDGAIVVVAAGNSQKDACKASPSSTPSAISVGASNADDLREPSSNYGLCVDVFAPGTYIRSAWIGSQSAYVYISGTSMAAPHVAGAVAIYTASSNKFPTVEEVREWLSQSSTKDILSNVEPGLPSCCYAKRKRRSMTFHDISETKLTRVKRRPGKGSSRSKSSRSPGSKDDEFEISSGSGENEDDDTPELEAAKKKKDKQKKEKKKNEKKEKKNKKDKDKDNDGDSNSKTTPKPTTTTIKTTTTTQDPSTCLCNSQTPNKLLFIGCD